MMGFEAPRLVTTRAVAPDECPWLESVVPTGTEVFECIKATYGAIGRTGIAVTLDADGGYPFFELPVDAIQPARAETNA